MSKLIHVHLIKMRRRWIRNEDNDKDLKKDKDKDKELDKDKDKDKGEEVIAHLYE